MGQERKKKGVINVAHSGTKWEREGEIEAHNGTREEKGRGDKCGAQWDK